MTDDKNHDSQTLLTKQEAAAFLRVSTRTFDRYRSLWAAKKLPTGEVRLRGAVRFKRAVLEQIVDDRRYRL